MAVYHDARCRLCRREGTKLFLKGARCFTDKCAFERRGYAPGEHGKSRRGIVRYKRWPTGLSDNVAARHGQVEPPAPRFSTSRFGANCVIFAVLAPPPALPADTL